MYRACKMLYKHYVKYQNDNNKRIKNGVRSWHGPKANKDAYKMHKNIAEAVKEEEL